MLFNSLHFFFFFTIFFFLYFRLPKRYRLVLLFISSCYFYMVYNPAYILILFSLILVDFFAGILLQQAYGNRLRKTILLTSILSNFGLLFYFKYAGLFTALQHSFSGSEDIFFYNSIMHFALPIGLSFHTFQSVGYIVQVYRKQYSAETNLLKYSNFVLFFPQLVAGPIEKPQNLLPQFNLEKQFDYERTVAGLYKISWGLFKKIVIADRLSFITSTVFNNVEQFTGLSILLAVLFFGIQIYADFSGYSDIARGVAQILGFNLSLNFRQPYFAGSLYEFWRRWHITLTNWFREYIYIPLGGNRGNKAGWYANIFLVFTLSGLWHGANLTFIAWGGWHGFFYIIEMHLRKIAGKQFILFTGFVNRIFVIAVIFAGWIFFRANNLSEVQYIFLHLFTNIQLQAENLLKNHGFTYMLFGISPLQLLLDFLLIILLFCVDAFIELRAVISSIRNLSKMKRWSLYYAFIIITCLLAVNNSREFIYFQF